MLGEVGVGSAVGVLEMALKSLPRLAVLQLVECLDDCAGVTARLGVLRCCLPVGAVLWFVPGPRDIVHWDTSDGRNDFDRYGSEDRYTADLGDVRQ